MLDQILYSVLLAALAIVVKDLYARISLYLKKRHARRAYGCEEPIRYPHSDRIWGTDLVRLRKQALQEGRLKLLYLKQHRELGETWQENANGNVRIVTISGANLRHMYALHTSSFVKTGPSNPASRRLFGRGILSTEGDAWRWNRKLIVPTFSRYETSTMPMLETHVNRFMANLPVDGQTFDAQPLIKRLFLDLASEFLLGEPLGMQLPENRYEAEAFLKIFDAALLGFNKRRQGFDLTSIKLWFDRSWDADVAKLHAFIDTHVQKALARTAGDDSAKDSPNAAGRYILLDEMAKQIRDPKLLRSAIIQCFMPGRDSTAILVSNTLFMLARHPHHWERLRPVAVSVGSADELSFQKLSKLLPLRHAVLEALRLLGPGGINKRFAAEDIVFPEGGGVDGKSPLFVPKGAEVYTHLPVVHRNKSHWGDNADEYRPERFEKLTTGWEFKPFLAGPRTCPAKDQVVIQATYILLRLLKRYEGIENRDDVLEFVEMSRLTTESRRGAQIALIPAQL